MKQIPVIFLLFVLCGCAAKITHETTDDAGMPWQNMVAASAKAEAPYRLQLSMRAGEEGDTRRITALLWGNPNGGQRLDVMAGVGAIIAKISDSATQFLLYSPREEKAYLQEGTVRPTFKIGVPVPFTLAQITDLLCGRYSQVFGTVYENAKPEANGSADYTVPGPLAGNLVINAYGAPLTWKQQKGGWNLKLSYADETSLLPQNIRIENVNGKFAVIMVKQREEPASPFTPEQLKLNLPSHITPLPFSQYRP